MSDVLPPLPMIAVMPGRTPRESARLFFMIDVIPGRTPRASANEGACADNSLLKSFIMEAPLEKELNCGKFPVREVSYENIMTLELF